MDPEEYADAAARLEREYLAGGMSADEYTRRRRELEDASTGEPRAAAGWTPMPPEPAQDPVPGNADPVTGAPLASWGRRAAGWFIDLLVYVAAFVATFLIALAAEDPATGETSDAAALLVFLVWLLGPTLYTWLMVGALGKTIGKIAVGITVVRSADADRVSYPRALGRSASTWLLGVLFVPILLAYLWPLWDGRKQTLYDKMAGTIVTRDRGAAAASD